MLLNEKIIILFISTGGWVQHMHIFQEIIYLLSPTNVGGDYVNHIGSELGESFFLGGVIQP